MDSITRNTDCVYRNSDLETLYTFKQFPVFMGCTEYNHDSDVFFDMQWMISKGSGLIQLNPLLPLDVVYSAEHGSGTTGKSWDEHHKAFANFISKYNPKSILEIGGLHGILAQKYFINNEIINWTIVEPNPRVDSSIPVKVIQAFFDDKFKSDEVYDMIVHSHVLEHVYDPDEFMSHKSSFMKEGDLLIFSIPNMQVMLENKYTNCINFEHTLYFTQPYIDHFLTKHGFVLVEKEFFKKDHSIFYCAKKESTAKKVTHINLYAENKKVFNDYISHYESDVKKINDIITSTSDPVYLFGAHIFSQYLISFGLDTSKIVYLLDNDAKKHDKRLYGTNLICKSPSILKEVSFPMVILRAGAYNTEVKNDILNNINSNTKFI